MDQMTKKPAGEAADATSPLADACAARRHQAVLGGAERHHQGRRSFWGAMCAFAEQ
jgi:hypothetical protein